jgi:uncharacterized protein YozE (UPF0346 family)
MEESTTPIESLLKHLISRHLVDNGEETETLSRFLELFEQFEEQMQNETLRDDGTNG